MYLFQHYQQVLYQYVLYTTSNTDLEILRLGYILSFSIVRKMAPSVQHFQTTRFSHSPGLLKDEICLH